MRNLKYLASFIASIVGAWFFLVHITGPEPDPGVSAVALLGAALYFQYLADNEPPRPP